ncbi:MAG: hypothetical protein ABJF88_01585 [Rhodothermales bacterium]
MLIVSLFAFVGCDSAEQQAEALVIRTERTSYSPGDTVSVSFENRRPATAYVLRSGCSTVDRVWLPVVLMETMAQGEWVPAARGVSCPAIATPPAELLPGDAYAVRLHVGVSRLPEIPPGTYRYVFFVRDEVYESETDLPEAERVSNAFTVR